MKFRGPVAPPVTIQRRDAADALRDTECPACGSGKGAGYFFCRRCAAALPGAVLYDLREASLDDMQHAFDRAMEVLR